MYTKVSVFCYFRDPKSYKINHPYKIRVHKISYPHCKKEFFQERIVVEPDPEVQRILALILERLNLTVEQVLESHPLLVQIKSDIQTLVQSENVIPIICAQRRKA